VARPCLLRFRVPRAASPLESGRPGSSTSQHLPSMAFLRPSTAYSSRRLACPVSYRHHLWDSKNTNETTSACVPDRATLGTVPSGITSRTRRGIEKHLQGSVAAATAPTESSLKRALPVRPDVTVSLTVATASRSGGRRALRQARPFRPKARHVGRTNSRGVTHRRHCKQKRREEGTATSATTRTDHEHRPLRSTTTAPLPDRRPSRPLRKTGCSIVRITAPCTPRNTQQNDPSGKPRGLPFGPPSALCYESVT
jgi:hypothetical protein